MKACKDTFDTLNIKKTAQKDTKNRLVLLCTVVKEGFEPSDQLVIVGEVKVVGAGRVRIQ